MKQIIFILMLAFALPSGTNAQLSKLMSQYHEQSCATVTQLDKNLYGLYRKDNLPPEAEEMLQKIDEVNLLNLDLCNCNPEITEKAIAAFRKVLDNPDKYKIVKSHSTAYNKQLIYTHQKNGQITDLVVWNQNPQRLDIIELRGDIQLDKIALLSKALNLKGLNSLAALSSRADAYEAYKQGYHFPDTDEWLEHMRRMREKMQGMFTDSIKEYFPFGEADAADGFFGDAFENFPGLMEGFMMDIPMFGPEQMEELFKNGAAQQKMEKIFRSFGDGENVMSNSVQITEENGKTKIKIDSKNADMTYIIDGKEAPKDNVQMPEGILNVNIIPSKEDLKKSYLFITSKDKLGEFISYREGVLTFRYDDQEYKYNLDKSRHPLLVIDGRLSADFDTDPSSILQIRPLSPIERKVGYYPDAEVIINTK